MSKVVKATKIPHKHYAGNPFDTHVHDTFSVLDGLGKPEDVVKRAVELKWPVVAITNHGNMMSAPIIYKAAKEAKIKPMIGCELYVVPDEFLGVQDKAAQKKSYHLTTLALSAEGYHNLVAWTTFANRRDEEFQNYYHKPRISLSAMVDVAPYPMHHNVIYSGCLSGELLRYMLDPSRNGDLWTGAELYIDMMKTLFPNFYIELQNHRVPKFVGKGLEAYEDLLETEEIAQRLLIRLHKITGVPLVVTNDSHMQWSNQRKSHLAMKIAMWKHNEGAMDHMSPSALNEQLQQYSYFGNYMRNMEEVADGLPKAVRDSALENVVNIGRECDINLSPLDKFSYSIPFSGYDDPIAKMRKRSASRLKKLEKTHGKLAKERFEHEIKSMGDFAHYLMLMSDFIRGARKMGIRTHTRGSAANSLLCYCLGIHDIDSLHYRLTFERFYNPSRKKLPDIDIDINPDRYDDFMRMVFERMEVEEGKGQVVKICNYGTFANRAAFRLVAESQGVDKEIIDEISKLLPSMIDSGMVDEEDDAFELIKEEYPQIYELASGVFDSVKSISQHACAWLFGTKDRPVETWIPLTLIASSNTLVTQYNYKLIDKYFGLVKGDFLKLKTLSLMDRTMELANLPFDFEIPLDDPETFEMLCKGDTEGVHSMQGKTQRQGCLEVQPQSVFDLVAIQALYRPSGTRTGFDKVFVARRHGKEKIKKIHPIADEHLKETYGLPIYQESTLDIGYALGMTHEEIQQLLDAIKLAKGVGRGAAEAFEKIKPMFMAYAKKAGFDKDARIELWRLIDAFQGYGFNKGHATSYGILADQTAYLKRHHPREFYTALLDVYPDKSKYIAAARGSGFRFDAPCVNFSQSGFSPGTNRNTIRVGLSRIKYLGPVAVREIIEHQPFASFDDFQSRVARRAINTTKIDVLAAVGAFDNLGVERPLDFTIKRKEKGKEKVLFLEGKDLIEFVLLGFCLDTPEAMHGIRPLHVIKQDGKGEWRHKGYQSGVELTEGPVSVSKMFWIPPLPKANIYEKKASAWAKVKTTLVTAIDENGIPFQLKANEAKAKQVETLDLLASKCRGAVVCLDGAVRSPFLQDGKSPLSFQLFNVTGSFKNDPQIYFEHDRIDDIKLAIEHLARKKNPE
jgi:DNA polymerase-3 subunit alpha